MLAFLAELFSTMGTVFTQTWFLLIPFTIFPLFKDIWLNYIGGEFWGSRDYMMLEIIPPREVEKSPKIMEAVYLGIAGVMTSPNTYETLYIGKHNPFVSFEIVSTEGIVHFYVWLPRDMRGNLESNLYAQYPDIEIREAEDYTKKVPAVIPSKEWDLYGYDLEHTAPEIVPIKTYQYFDEDVTGKMIDPLAALIEAMGSVGRGHHFWFQITVHPVHESTGETIGKPHLEELAGRSSKEPSIMERLLQDASDVISGVPKGITAPVEFAGTGETADEQPLEFRLTPVERDVLKNVETNMGKNFFSTKLRMVYIAHKDVFSKSHWGAFMGAIKQFSEHNYNGFMPADKSKTYANYVLTDQRLAYRKRQILRRYRGRYPTGSNCMLSTEELATIFHMPDLSVVSPSIRFVDARRSGAPTNLPLQQ